mmetsp:Transcript_40760/g.70538  ORF Transcript_40760/g.70538 Transcript_40760/m.70538 type:complete len:235 (+) Transcript_40760:4694-5398(+)
MACSTDVNNAGVGLLGAEVAATSSLCVEEAATSGMAGADADIGDRGRDTDSDNERCRSRGAEFTDALSSCSPWAWFASSCGSVMTDSSSFPSWPGESSSMIGGMGSPCRESSPRRRGLGSWRAMLLEANDNPPSVWLPSMPRLASVKLLCDTSSPALSSTRSKPPIMLLSSCCKASSARLLLATLATVVLGVAAVEGRWRGSRPTGTPMAPRGHMAGIEGSNAPISVTSCQPGC